jgi:ATP/maltotriose-dependent transcriptional regulator MalT
MSTTTAPSSSTRARRRIAHSTTSILPDADRRQLREREVFRLMAHEYASAPIGDPPFYISAKTVDTYRRRINDKMGFAERSDYIRLALDLGLLANNSR